MGKELNIYSNFFVTSSDEMKGYLIVYKNFDIRAQRVNDYQLIPAHNSSIKDIFFSPSDNKLYSLGEEGVVVQWNMLSFHDHYSKVFMLQEYLVDN